MKALGIIPARGGSKGVPNKNIREIAGLPLIAHSILQAKRAELLSDVIVTSDSDEILNICAPYDLFLHKRAPALATDQAGMVPVVEDILVNSELSENDYDCFVLLQPTCPLRTSKVIDQAVTLLAQKNTDCVVSVCEVGDAHPARMYKIDREFGSLTPLMPEFESFNRQNLPSVYHRNGLIYGLKTRAFLTNQKFVLKSAVPLITDQRESINIDEPLDFEIAQSLMRSS